MALDLHRSSLSFSYPPILDIVLSLPLSSALPPRVSLPSYALVYFGLFCGLQFKAERNFWLTDRQSNSGAAV